MYWIYAELSSLYPLASRHTRVTDRRDITGLEYGTPSQSASKRRGGDIVALSGSRNGLNDVLELEQTILTYPSIFYNWIHVHHESPEQD